MHPSSFLLETTPSSSMKYHTDLTQSYLLQQIDSNASCAALLLHLACGPRDSTMILSDPPTSDNFMGGSVISRRRAATWQPERQSPATRQRRCSKRVTFGNVYTYSEPTTFSNSSSSCSGDGGNPEDPPPRQDQLWWDRDALGERRALDMQLVANNAVDLNPDYHESMLYLMKSYKKQYQCRSELVDRVKALNGANVRGLEQRIVPMLKMYRSVASKEVLKFQDQLRRQQHQYHNMDDDIVAVLMRQRALKYSRASRQLAFRLAQADSLEANSIYDGK
jgi:hypothetical protein